MVAAFLIFLFAQGASAASFADTANHPLAWQVEFLRDRGIVKGYTPSIFRPDYPINRAEFLKILTLAVYGDAVLEAGNRVCFRDFTGQQQQWYWTYACAAKERGVVQGYADGTFRGEQRVNTVEALRMAIDAWKIRHPLYFRDPENWYDPYVDIAAARGLFDILPRFPGHLLTRSEAAALLVGLGEEIRIVRIEDSEDAEDAEDPSSGLRTGSEEPEVPVIVDHPDEAMCGNGVLEEREECDDGNLNNGDGCSQICVSVPEPVRHAALRIEQHERKTTVDATPRTRGHELLSFSAVAGRQNVNFTGIKFRAEEGKISDATNYRLLVDGDGDGTPEKLAGTAKVEGSILVFSGMKTILGNGMLTEFVLLADLASSAAAGTLRIGFASGETRYIEAVGTVDGRELLGLETDDGGCTGPDICWIAVKTARAKDVAVSGKGNLFVTKDSVSQPGRQLLLGTLTEPFLRLQFRATGEDIAVTSLRIGGGAASMDRLELLLAGRSEPFATLQGSDCTPVIPGKFCAASASSLLVVPKDLEMTVVVRAHLRSDADGGTSGEVTALTLSANTTTDIAVEARGVSSESTLSQNDGDTNAEGEVFIGTSSPGANAAIIGSTHDLTAAKIVGVTNANPDPDGTPVPLGKRAFGQFRFTAATHGNTKNGLDDVTITKLVFTVTAVNVQIESTSFALANKADPSRTSPCTADRVTGTITVTCNNLDDGAASTVIEQGSAIELALQGSTALVDTTGEKTLQTALGQLGDRNLPGTIIWEDDYVPFQWVDIGMTQVKSTVYRTK